jgi:hypothetical protein
MVAINERYWIGVASRNHVERGVEGGFSQLCHGKASPLRRMAVGDWLIYYSPKEIMGGDVPCQQFTAIGQVVGGEIYPFRMFPDFVPYRRDVHFLMARDVPIHRLIGDLSFIKDKRHWGYAFRFGHLEISRSDFQLIAHAMLGNTAAITLSAASEYNAVPNG